MYKCPFTGDIVTIWDSAEAGRKNRIRQERTTDKYKKVLREYNKIGFRTIQIGYKESLEKETFLRGHDQTYWLTPEGRIYIAPEDWETNQPKESE